MYEYEPGRNNSKDKAWLLNWLEDEFRQDSLIDPDRHQRAYERHGHGHGQKGKERDPETKIAVVSHRSEKVPFRAGHYASDFFRATRTGLCFFDQPAL